MKPMELKINGKYKTYSPEQIDQKVETISMNVAKRHKRFSLILGDIEFLVEAFNCLEAQYRELELQNQDVPY